MYQINRIKGKSFKTDSLMYAVARFTEDKNISLVFNLETGDVVIQRVKEKEKLDSQQGTWKHLQNS